MKKIVIILALISFGFSFAQVAIGKSSIDGDGILDFASNLNQGIILPRVTSLPSTVTPGTLLFDTTDNTIKFRNNSSWVVLTGTTALDNGASNVSYLTNTAEIGNGVIIGANTSSATGVLVLESADKALILPKLENPELNILSPEPGTICYDTAKNAVAIFNGNVWTYYQ